MNNKLNLFLWRQKVYLLSKKILYPVIVLVLALLLVLQISITQGTAAQLELQRGELGLLNALATNYRNNVVLPDNERKVLSSTLLLQMPDKENIFSLIGALGELSDLTGFTIDKYQLNDDPQQTAVQITAQATGTPDQINEFLRIYQFGTSRFLSMEAFKLGIIDIESEAPLPQVSESEELVEEPVRTTTQEVSITFTISFHTEQLLTDRNALVQFLPEDEKALAEFKENLNYDLFFAQQAALNDTTSDDYEPTTQLFE